MKKFPLITAHTGNSGHPDHSIESLCAALKLGADVYEDDIRVTRDGVPVLAHDDEVELAGGRRGRLSELTLEQFTDLSAAPVLELADVLNWIRTAGRTMNLDIKVDEALEPVAALIARTDMADQVFLSGCEYERAKLAERLGVPLRKLLNVNAEYFRTLSYEEATERVCEEARSAGCFGLNLPHPVVRPQLIEAAKRAGLAVCVWTVADAEDMRRMARWGVDSITTRDPATLVAVRSEPEFTEANEDWTTDPTIS